MREYGGIAKFICSKPAIETIPDFLVGDNRKGADHSGDIECLCRRAKSDAYLGSLRAWDSKRDMAFAGMSQVGMDFIRDDQYSFPLADLRKGRKFLFTPDLSAGIMRIRQNQESSLRKFFQGFEIHKITFSLFNQRDVDHVPAVFLWRNPERMIDRGHDIDVVSRFGEIIDHHADSLNDARDIANPFRLNVPSVEFFLPIDYCRPIVGRFGGISKYGMPESLFKIINNKWRSSEIHIRHPCRNQIIAAESFGKAIGLNRSTASSLYYLVEITTCHICFIKLGVTVCLGACFNLTLSSSPSFPQEEKQSPLSCETPLFSYPQPIAASAYESVEIFYKVKNFKWINWQPNTQNLFFMRIEPPISINIH